jgi:hypothetical protein
MYFMFLGVIFISSMIASMIYVIIKRNTSSTFDTVIVPAFFSLALTSTLHGIFVHFNLEMAVDYMVARDHEVKCVKESMVVRDQCMETFKR